jgi:hypothetical protein
LRDALSASCGVVDAFLQPAHAVRGVARPRLETLGRTGLRIIQEARAILAGRGVVQSSGRDVLSIEMIRAVIGTCAR